jgi:hypothetical protein
MDQNRKSGYGSLMQNKKLLIVAAAAAILATMTLSANAFIEDNTEAKKYEKNQAASGANACGNEELPLNVLCDNTASEIQGDENAVGLSSAQQGGSIEPYENLVDEVSMQSALDDQSAQLSDSRLSAMGGR